MGGGGGGRVGGRHPVHYAGGGMDDAAAAGTVRQPRAPRAYLGGGFSMNATSDTWTDTLEPPPARSGRRRAETGQTPQVTDIWTR